jgi:hypothetical protein
VDNFALRLVGSESSKVESPEIGDSTFVISDEETVGIGLRALICARQIVAKVEHLQDGLDDSTQGGYIFMLDLFLGSLRDSSDQPFVFRLLQKSLHLILGVYF